MHIEFLVEEPSAEVALSNLLPRILAAPITFTIHPFGGKKDLLSQLPSRLKGYKRWLPQDWRIVVLIDKNGENCVALKSRLERIARQAGFVTKSSAAMSRKFQVLTRLAIEELESWFIGDMEALTKAYPKVPLALGKKEKFRNPDEVQGGTWEQLERVLQRAGYYAGGMPKVEVARQVSSHMDPSRNSSHSFKVFRDGILACFHSRNASLS
jgi:Domain of unknown function (DUF4276)